MSITKYSFEMRELSEIVIVINIINVVSLCIYINVNMRWSLINIKIVKI